MTLLRRIENVTKLWGMILPYAPSPTPAWIGRWCDVFADEVIEQAIIRTSKKFKGGAPDPESVWKYCFGVARNIDKEQSLAAPKENQLA
jgi:hypothetical protein